MSLLGLYIQYRQICTLVSVLVLLHLFERCCDDASNVNKPVDPVDPASDVALLRVQSRVGVKSFDSIECSNSLASCARAQEWFLRRGVGVC